MTDPGGPNNGPGTGPGGTDLKQPPAYFEGDGGGPALPEGPALSQADKDRNGEVMDEYDGYVSYVWDAAAFSALGEPEDSAVPVVLGAIAGAAHVFGGILRSIFCDPPQPAYARPVVFKQRISHPPAVPDVALEPLRICVQQAVFGAVNGQGYLDAIERLQGAQLAGDITWVLVHRGVADLARQQHIINIANNGAALYAAGNALKGTRYDIALKPGTASVKKWINKRGTKAALTTAMHSSGLTPAEITSALEYAATDPQYTGPTSTLSDLLIENAEQIYDIAVKLDER